ncbi:rhodanese-like domain-containing protein [Rhodoferax antarcticus]|uniref:Rhodanese-like protein n=2 Tax=Rhodoferax antarcticus TaxID=81479 RepID=A0A1Q8YBU9_9BURK|nr:rhodanese-like domain-containing protein [Rhodoferax antarcticus]APW48339.1 sulfurtransferase [Rhodoferax antarcticus]OLP05465.1 rhodanese-like protein [Rhodoferax antarcticus ANT.BR]
MKRVLLAMALGLSALGAQAVEMGANAQDVYAEVQKADSKVLFVDVRDPLEIMFVGFTDAVHVNIPFLMVDKNAWEDKRGVFKLNQNPDFVAQIKSALEKRGLATDAEVITMCRSGSERGEPSAAFLRANGFPNARYVIHGFQGAALKDGPQAGFRLQNGWQNSGLPWSAKMNPAKMYRTDLK